MTVKELHAAIREQTMAINARLVEYYEHGATDKLVNKELAYLRNVTGTSEKSQYIAMRTHRKTKDELELQLQELRYFEGWDIFTPKGHAERVNRERRAYRSYKRSTGSTLQYQTYKTIVNILGTAGEDLLKQFGNSFDTVNVIDEAVRKGKKSGTIMKALRRVVKENEGQQKSTTDYINDLRNMLDLTL